MICPHCGNDPAQPPLPTQGEYDVTVRRVDGQDLAQPARIHRPGIYVVGVNEDGKRILTYVEREGE